MNTNFYKSIAESRPFNNFILIVILLAGVLVGIETYASELSGFHTILHFLDLSILLIFTFEFFVKILAEGDKPMNYFKDPWNVFDFIIVAVCWVAMFIPEINAGFVAVIRLARVLRVLRLVHALPQLKMLVNAMLKSIPSMGYVGILLFLLFYIYGAMGVFLFGKNDPMHFANLHTALITLFQIVTLEGWADIMYVNIYGCDHPDWGTENCTNPIGYGVWGALYFITFVLVGTMIVLNLFIGVIMNSMQEAATETSKAEEAKLRRAQGTDGSDDLAHQLLELQHAAQHVAERAMELQKRARTSIVS